MLRKYQSWLVFLLTYCVYAIERTLPTVHKVHTFTAWRLLHGHVDLGSQVAVWEHIQYAGRSFALQPILPAVVMMPSVAIWGPIRANQTMVMVVIAAASVGLCWEYLLRIMPEHAAMRVWLTAFFAFGTLMYYDGTRGEEWSFALVLTTVPTWLALIELVRAQPRAWRVGVWAGLVFLSRYELAVLWPLYAAWLVLLSWQRPRWRAVAAFAIGPILALAVYVWYAEARFGLPYDIVYWRWFLVDTEGARKFPGLGVFSLHYVPWNLYTALFMGPNFGKTFPWYRPHYIGQAIILTSPAFLLALRARIMKEAALLWTMVVVSSIPWMLIYSNGITQFGFRHAIEQYPFLIALMALGWPKKMSGLDYGLITASIVLIVAGTSIIRFWGWGV